MPGGGFTELKADFLSAWQKKRSFRITFYLCLVGIFFMTWLLISTGICSKRVSRNEYRQAFDSLKQGMTRDQVEKHLKGVATRFRSDNAKDTYLGISFGKGYCGCTPVMTDVYEVNYHQGQFINSAYVGDTWGLARNKQ